MAVLLFLAILQLDVEQVDIVPLQGLKKMQSKNGTVGALSAGFKLKIIGISC